MKRVSEILNHVLAFYQTVVSPSGVSGHHAFVAKRVFARFQRKRWLVLLGLLLYWAIHPISSAQANYTFTPYQKEPELSFRAIGSDNLTFSIWAACQRVLMTHWTAYPIFNPDMSSLDEPFPSQNPNTQPVLPELGEPD